MVQGRASRRVRIESSVEWLCPLALALAWLALVCLGVPHDGGAAAVPTPPLATETDLMEVLPLLIIDVQLVSAGWTTS